MDCQNWDPVVLRNTKARQQRAAAEAASRPKMSAEAIRMAKLANDEEVKRPKLLSKQSRQEMMQLRAAQKWTQRDLDMRCSFPANTVRDIEAGKVAPTAGQLSRLNQILKAGLKLETAV
jgi:ribosome-binding protein aMBF1 (putative translation factor)